MGDLKIMKDVPNNVDYDDVLHLYRSWRKAEVALKDKNKELSTWKGRVKQLQESHVKFRGQMEALEAVKELTIRYDTFPFTYSN